MKYVLFIIVFALCIGSVSEAQIRIDKGLVAFFPFEGNAKDNTKYHQNAVVYGPELIPVDAKGRNQACQFDGQDDYILFKASDELKAASDALSISVWIRPNRQYYNAIIANEPQTVFLDLSKYDRIGISFKGPEMDYSGAEKYWGRLCPNYRVSFNQWTHIAVTYHKERGLVVLYANGQIIHKAKIKGDLDLTGDDFYIGKRKLSSYPEHFSGMIDNVRLYTRALCPAEVNVLYDKEVKDFMFAADDIKQMRFGKQELKKAMALEVAFDQTGDFLSIRSSQPDSYTALVYDATGKIRVEREFSVTVNLDIVALMPGAYLLEIRNAETVLRREKFWRN